MLLAQIEEEEESSAFDQRILFCWLLKVNNKYSTGGQSGSQITRLCPQTPNLFSLIFVSFIILDSILLQACSSRWAPSSRTQAGKSNIHPQALSGPVVLKLLKWILRGQRRAESCDLGVEGVDDTIANSAE